MALASGTRVGPYEILAPLGAGGMGEVYRARDPRLSRDVAVKLIATDDTPSPDRLRRFETEARAAAQLAHPNVVTVHDVGTDEGRPYLVLELLEGETMREALRRGIPPLRDAVTWALEVSRGLAAAHERGIVHRDLKPDNVFLTRDGRVKVFDFGLAKLSEPLVTPEDRESPTATRETSPGVLVGTLGYMSPEQVRGEAPDPRTDVFALGTVLYEMVAGRRAFSGRAASEVLAAILRDEPPALPPAVPATLESVVRRCLAKRAGDRFSSGRAVEAALETVLASLEPGRVSVTRPAEPRGPYPGLSSFTEADAERFFGREAEVKALWERLKERRLLALIGPSGAGKTSFVRAGVAASRPSGWSAIVATPGGTPMRALGQALVGGLPSDADTMKQLLAFDDEDVALDLVRRWRQGHAEALLVVDQFEELFTLSPAEVQGRFAGLLGRVAGEADVHVLLSMRDDFLIRCHEHKPLEPVFQNLTPILALGGDDLRRALVEPAKKEGFAFEDEALVAEMLEAVEGTRGALPLLAFAVSRLWEKRDRERKLLTRAAYEEIGGVAGALAQHAEQTLERIGLEREPIVRELFRNLVTAQWTRAAADREELLSVLPDGEAGAQVLDQLVDARLLTSYEVRDEVGSEVERGEAQARHRIEIVHESLLRAWPRLVRWQAQDEEGAVLRDQLKQAAHLWEEKGRPDDLLWTGTSEREFELWQDRYPGKLTALEDDFALAMVDRTRRRRRLRRAAIATLVVGLAAVATVIGILWRRSAAQERRAEAAQLLSLAQQRLSAHPTEALAYATASLELADRREAREAALEALEKGPVEIRTPIPAELGLDVSPDGRWMVARRTAEGGLFGGAAALWPSDGGSPVALEGSEGSSELRFSPKGDLVAGPMDSERRTMGVWSVPGGRLVRRFRLGERGQVAFFRLSPDSRRVLTCRQEAVGRRAEMECRMWEVGGGESRLLAHLETPFESWATAPSVNVAWTRLAWADGRTARVAPLDGGRLNAAVALAIDHGATLSSVVLDDQGRTLLTASDSGKSVRIWSLDGGRPRLVRTLTGPERGDFRFDTRGLLVAASSWLADLTCPPDTEPLRLQGCNWAVGFDPGSRWLATPDAASCSRVSLWPLSRRHPRVLAGHTADVPRLAFTPDGRRLVSTSLDGSVRLWDLGASATQRSRVLHRMEGAVQGWRLAMASNGSFVAVGNNLGQVVVLPLDGGVARELTGFTDVIQGLTVSPGGRLVAAGAGTIFKEEALVRVWDLETGGVRVLDAGDGAAALGLQFTGENQLFVRSAGPTRRRWDLGQSPPRVLDETDLSASALGGRFEWQNPEQGELLLSNKRRLWIQDLGTGTTRDVAWVNEGSGYWVGLDPSGKLVLSRNPRGVIGVASARGGEPHLLLRHPGGRDLAVSPDGRWIASGGSDGTIRLWPMPDLSKPPPQTLPHDELLAQLRSATNVRAVRDGGSVTGWKIEAGPFAGWERLPEW